MPWWAWLLIGLFVVGATLGVFGVLTSEADPQDPLEVAAAVVMGMLFAPLALFSAVADSVGWLLVPRLRRDRRRWSIERQLLRAGAGTGISSDLDSDGVSLRRDGRLFWTGTNSTLGQRSPDRYEEMIMMKKDTQAAVAVSS
jgi:hypothetical protein